MVLHAPAVARMAIADPTVAVDHLVVVLLIAVITAFILKNAFLLLATYVQAKFVNNEHISRIEAGKKYPSLDLIVMIANALDVSADDLLTDNLKYSSSPVDTEIHDLLLDCNQDEKAILTKTVRFLKATLSEFGI